MNIQKKIEVPKNAALIIETLEKSGFRADIVGGCVRDALLGRTPYDYDITTSATPEEIKTAFDGFRILETGIKHGTVTVIIDSEPFEVTTYRFDGEYKDNRHPSSVTFTRDIRDDLARRDFTVNAMAYNEKDGLTDLFGGASDLSMGIIRAVGNPQKRFSEDALRILRALRFAAVLDFEIEEHTARALRVLCGNLRDVSAERIYTEWKKLLTGRGAHRILAEFSDVVEAFIPELSGFSLPSATAFRNSDSSVRELSLFAPFGDKAAALFLASAKRLKSDTKHKNEGTLALDNFEMPTQTERDVHKLAVKLGEDGARSVISLRVLLGKTDSSALKLLDALREKGACIKLSDMCIDGSDLLNRGYKGKEIGEKLSELLYRIADGELENDRELLLSLL